MSLVRGIVAVFAHRWRIFRQAHAAGTMIVYRPSERSIITLRQGLAAAVSACWPEPSHSKDPREVAAKRAAWVWAGVAVGTLLSVYLSLWPRTTRLVRRMRSDP